MRRALEISAVVVLSLVIAPPPASADGIPETLNVLCGTVTSLVEACFAPVVDLGPIFIPTAAPTVDPGTGSEDVGYAGIVRLVVSPGLVEFPLPSFAADGALCSVYSEVPFSCVEVFSQLVSVPTSDPSIDPQPGSVFLARAYAGTLTLKIDGEPAAVVPAYVDLRGCEGRETHTLSFDIDCDGATNGAELNNNDPTPCVTSASNLCSNPLYKYSSPDDGDAANGDENGIGFFVDWDGDRYANSNEIFGSPQSNPFQRCSTPSAPNGWTLTNPTHSCES